MASRAPPLDPPLELTRRGEQCKRFATFCKEIYEKCSSGRRVILPPATTFLHINRALDIFGAIIVAWNEKETLFWSMKLEVLNTENY